MTAGWSAIRFDRALFAGAALFAALAIWPFLPAAAPPQSTPPAPPAPLRMPAPLPPLSRFSALVERPLFSPSRRPVASERLDLGNSGLAARYRLLGIMIDGGRQTALIGEGTRRFELGVGESLAGWTVARIEQDRVVLNSASGEAALTFRPAAEAPASRPADRAP